MKTETLDISAPSINLRYSSRMAKPIEPTPPLDAEDSEALLRDLERGCSPEEAQRRERQAELWLARVTTPKGRPSESPRD